MKVCTSSGWTGEPYAAVDRLTEWSDGGDVLRFIVTDTPVNLPVLLGPVRHGQKDGTCCLPAFDGINRCPEY